MVWDLGGETGGMTEKMGKTSGGKGYIMFAMLLLKS